MNSSELRKKHFESFAKLSISQRLSWAFNHSQFFRRFMDSEARALNKKFRRQGKKYFGD